MVRPEPNRVGWWCNPRPSPGWWVRQSRVILFLAIIFLAAVIGGGAAAAVQNEPTSPLYGFQFATNVTDQSTLDLDVEVMRQVLSASSSSSSSSFHQAMAIYERGAVTQPTLANVTLLRPLQYYVLSNSVIVGVNRNRSSLVRGTVAISAQPGQQFLTILYDTGTNCQVGGNPNPQTQDCLAETGNITVSEFALPLAYSYRIDQDNGHYRTLQNLTSAQGFRKYSGQGDYYSFYGEIVLYYGQTEFINAWIQAALSGTRLDIRSRNITVDFQHLSQEGRMEAAISGAAYSALGLSVLGQWEDALDHCSSVNRSSVGLTKGQCDILQDYSPNCQCPLDSEEDCNPLFSLDESVAYYVGSMGLRPGSSANTGLLLYSLADEMCSAFATCGTHGNSNEGTSWVNLQMMQHLSQMQTYLTAGYCFLAEEVKTPLYRLWLVPIVQATLEAAYMQGLGGSSQDAWIGGRSPIVWEARAATLASIVLPWLHECSEADAEFLASELLAVPKTNSTANWEQVRHALEANYNCLGITCNQVGGLWDGIGYKPGAAPCTFSYNQDNNSDSTRLGLALGLPVGLVVLFAATYFWLRSKPGSTTEVDEDHPVVDTSVIHEHETV